LVQTLHKPAVVLSLSCQLQSQLAVLWPLLQHKLAVVYHRRHVHMLVAVLPLFWHLLLRSREPVTVLLLKHKLAM
jgi:hypothetical protein